MTDCPACLNKRRHTDADWLFHPLKGHGFNFEKGWTFKPLAIASTDNRDSPSGTHSGVDAQSDQESK